MRVGVGVKFGFWLSLLGVAAVAATAHYAYSEAQTILLGAAKARLVTATTVLGRRFTAALNEIARDVTLVSRAEEVDELARGSNDPEPLKRRLADIFADVLDLHPDYLQLRLIGANEFGRELVRVDRTGDGTVRVTGSHLQEKGHYPYVFKTLAQPRDSFYLSQINLNRERGVRFGIDQPTVRVAEPVYGAGASPFGLIVLNVDLDDLFAQLRADLPSEIELYLTNSQGDYLIHPDAAKTFGFDRGRREKIQDDYAAVREVLAGRTGSIVLETSERVAAFVDVPFGEIASDRHVLLGLAIPAAVAMREIEPFGRQLVLIVSGFSVLAVLLSFVLSKLLVRPLDRVVSALNRFSRGQPLDSLPGTRNDEIGLLSRSFTAMAEQIGGSIEALRRNERSLHRVLETAPSDIIIAANSDHRILFMNTSAHARFQGDGAGPSLHPLERGLGVEAAERLYAELARSGTVEYAEHRFRMADGDELWALLSLVGIEYQGHSAILFSIVDVTRRKEAELELEQYRSKLEALVEERTAALVAAQRDSLRNERLAAIGQLTGTVSHELRNPLGTIHTSFVMLRKLLDVIDPRVEKAIERIDRSISRCDRIIQELLDYTRIRDLVLVPTELDGWLAQLLDEQEIPASVRLERSLRSSARLAIDRDRMAQAVINVVQNACQAMCETEPPMQNAVLGVRTRTVAGRVEIEFEDNGPGIPAADQQRIFEPLFSTRAFGIGLGLPLVKQVIEQHEGGIEIRSHPGRGTCVTIWLPASD